MFLILKFHSRYVPEKHAYVTSITHTGTGVSVFQLLLLLLHRCVIHNESNGILIRQFFKNLFRLERYSFTTGGKGKGEECLLHKNRYIFIMNF